MAVYEMEQERAERKLSSERSIEGSVSGIEG